MKAWHNPLPLDLLPSTDPISFMYMNKGETALPLSPHPGSFGFRRKHHTHEGIDLYAPPGTEVMCVEGGVVVVIEPFTGPLAGSPWWHDTQAVFIEGDSGVVVYGEIIVSSQIDIGDNVKPGDVIGHLTPVLKKEKGRPACMLHLELHEHGTRCAPGWEHDAERPITLRDPTCYLASAINC